MPQARLLQRRACFCVRWNRRCTPMSMLSAIVRPGRGSTGSAGAIRNMDLACGAFFCAIRVRIIGRCGDTMQDCDGVRVPEVRYLLERAHWHRGYAAEAAAVCRGYAFTPLGFDEVFSSSAIQILRHSAWHSLSAWNRAKCLSNTTTASICRISIFLSGECSADERNGV